MKLNSVKIFCRKNEKNKLTFYAGIPYEGEVFLLNRKYREDQYKEYVNGVPLVYVLKKTRLSQKQKLRDHIIRNLKYIEKEYEICIFKKTMKKENKKKCISYKQQNIDYEIA